MFYFQKVQWYWQHGAATV